MQFVKKTMNTNPDAAMQGQNTAKAHMRPGSQVGKKSVSMSKMAGPIKLPKTRARAKNFQFRKSGRRVAFGGF